jgi:hypothetical protein
MFECADPGCGHQTQVQGRGKPPSNSESHFAECGRGSELCRRKNTGNMQKNARGGPSPPTAPVSATHSYRYRFGGDLA